MFFGAVEDLGYDPAGLVVRVADEAGVTFAPESAAVFGQVPFTGGEFVGLTAAKSIQSFAVFGEVERMSDHADATADEFAVRVAEELGEGLVDLDKCPVGVADEGGHRALVEEGAVHVREERVAG